MVTTVSQLTSQIKQKINELHGIVDVLLCEYRDASDIIDDVTDRRKFYLDQLEELNEDISNIVDQHPALNVEKCWQSAMNVISAISDTSNKIVHI